MKSRFLQSDGSGFKLRLSHLLNPLPYPAAGGNVEFFRFKNIFKKDVGEFMSVVENYCVSVSV